MNDNTSDLEHQIQNETDEEWLAAISKEWTACTGQPWDTRDGGESREESLAANIGAIFRHIDKLNADLDYFRKNEKAGKRPFSDALSGHVIDGQVKRIQEMELKLLDLQEQLTEQDNIRGAMFASTIEAHKKRIAELEGPVNQFYAIERLLARRRALDDFATAGEKVAAMLHMCATADPSGELIKQAEK